MFKVSAGEGSLASGIGNEADLGTAFALATSLYGNNMLQVSGNRGIRVADRRAHAPRSAPATAATSAAAVRKSR